ncbi:helix-turn-helix transcriptional regulator [Leisingera caerulea]|uniref:helix-turn-helix transcriptional regulator n=1 Tax=Leisingera caerulea TaxID=506591 RepID=UPI0021A7B2A2|nr:WYL domain-containing protein [Leisingera caerulea]UWQ85013.1 WYL domain-containing protein [Leisingera caerulea]
MSYSNAIDLLRLADFAAARHRGVTLQEIEDEFQVARRTAQRMTNALEQAFPIAVEVLVDPDRTKRWTLREAPLARLKMHGDKELEALDYSIERLSENGDLRQRNALAALRDRLMAALPTREARRLEADAEWMLEAYGVAARPGPATQISKEIGETVSDAIRGPYLLRFSYKDTVRLVEPHGVLLGARRYLVAKSPGEQPMKHFRLDLIDSAEVIEEFFERDPNFDLNDHAAHAFGSFQSVDEYGPVHWRFTPDAARRAAEWQFHPAQQAEFQEDGSLDVRFVASGWLEMAWHLYQWGDSVEVLHPPQLANLVKGFQRDDFNALP